MMPIVMIPTGTTSVHQNSSEFFLIELSKSVFMFIVLPVFSSRYMSGELVEGMRIVDFSAHDVGESKSRVSSAKSVLCI